MTADEQREVCEFLGILAKEPQQWGLVFPGESFGVKWDPPWIDESQADSYLALPGIAEKGGYGKQLISAVYPNLLSGDGLLLMIEGLRKKEMRWDHMSMQSDTCPYGAAVFAPDEHRWGKHCYAPTLPEALFRAVLELARKKKG